MALFRSLIVWFAALASVQHVVLATEELTPERFKELTTSGKNGMVKFYQVCYLERRKTIARSESVASPHQYDL